MTKCAFSIIFVWLEIKGIYLKNRIVIYRNLLKQEFEDLASRIIYEDNHLLIINKKVGEIVQGDKTGDEPLVDTFKAFIAQRDSKPGHVFIGLAHRLDRPVSGLVVLAKTSKALTRLNEMFRGQDVEKYYWALVGMEPVPASGELNDHLYKVERLNKSFACRPGELRKDAKLAKLKYRTIGMTERYYMLEIQLLTGKHHQIRCQLANIGSPIKGDLKYGAPRSNPDGGISLHARRLSFVHPVRKETLVIQAPVPDNWPLII